MGGLVHLFDFNQALAGRKLLTDQKSGAGHEATKNGSEASVRAEISKLNSLKSKDSQNSQFRNELPTEMPVKTLIARDLSKVGDRTPSVVARLMGLEALPGTSKTNQKESARKTACSVKESLSQKPITAQCYEEKLPYSARSSPKKEESRNIGEGQTNDFGGTLSFRNHPQEEQLQEFKKDFEAWQRQKLGYSRMSSRNSNSVSHTTDKHVLSEKIHKISLPGNQGSAKIAKSHERLDESREFLDAMNFLQSNREFFAKFIEDSKSLLPCRAPESGSNNIVLPYPSKTMDARDSYLASDENDRVQPFTESSSLPRSYRFDPKNGSTKDAAMESNRFSNQKSQFESTGDAFDVQRYSRYADLSQAYSTNYQVPTRIVVLKPSPGRIRDLKSATPAYAPPTKEHVVDGEGIEKLRENLRKSKDRKHERRSARSIGNEVDSKDPRQIAREIARQVRENIKGNQMMKRMNDFIISDDDDYSNRQISNDNDFGNSVHCGDREDFIPTDRPCHQSNVMRLHQDRKFSLEVENERRKDASHQSRKSIKGNANEIFSKVNNMTMKNEVYSDNTSCQTSPAIGGGRYSVDGLGSSQKYRRALFHSYPQNNKDALQRSSVDDSGWSSNKVHVENNSTRFVAYDHVQTAVGQNSLEQINEMKSNNLMLKSDLNKLALEIRVSSDALEVEEMLNNEVTEQKGLCATHEKQPSPVNGDVIVNSYFTFSSSSMPVMMGNDKAIDLLGVVDLPCETAGEIETEYSKQTVKNNNQEHSFDESNECHFSTNNIKDNRAVSEQLSPVSVLDLPYQEESSLSRESTEIKSALQDIGGTADCAELQLYPHHNEHEMEFNGSFCALAERSKTENTDCVKDLASSDLFLENITYPSGKQAEMLYAKDVLIASGFMKHITSFPASSYVLHQWLNLDLFEKMENCYVEKAKDEKLNFSERHLIFDCVTEALCNILQRIATKPTSLSVPTSIDIFKHTWSYIHQLLTSHSESQNTLENLVSKDLIKKDQWLNMHLEIEALDHEMEGAILDDLIEEMLLVM